ncbi:MAG: SRPBCC family protein [Desulfatibacillaceae bacterium]|nr:SRPBCC family protein [Desulfatibacillaceae bacterium]
MKIIRSTFKNAYDFSLATMSMASQKVNGLQKFVVVQDFHASPDAVFEELSDPARMSLWAGIKLARIKAGQDPAKPNSTGSLRSVKVGPTSFVEEITSYDPPRGYTYTITEGSPMKDYTGRVEVAPRGSGCTVRWSVSFKSRIPLAGPVLVNATRLGFAKGLKKLSKRMAG